MATPLKINDKIMVSDIPIITLYEENISIDCSPKIDDS